MHKSNSAIVIPCVIFIIATVFTGCKSTPVSQYAPPRTPNEIIGALRESHPNGLLPNVVQTRMEENGFECTRIINGTWVHRVHHENGMTENRKIENIDFIHCKRKIPNGLVTSYDDVALIIENNVVVDALANWDAVGP